jgi:hypothetical protein
MGIKNGSGQHVDYDVDEPMPLGTYAASTTLTKTSITLMVVGAGLSVTSLVVEAGTALTIASIVAVLAAAGIETYNLLQGSGSSGGESNVGSGCEGTVLLTGTRQDLAPQQLDNRTLPQCTRVRFYEDGTDKVLADSGVIPTAGNLVTLKQKEGVRISGESEWYVEVT